MKSVFLTLRHFWQRVNHEWTTSNGQGKEVGADLEAGAACDSGDVMPH